MCYTPEIRRKEHETIQYGGHKKNKRLPVMNVCRRFMQFFETPVNSYYQLIEDSKKKGF